VRGTKCERVLPGLNILEAVPMEKSIFYRCVCVMVVSFVTVSCGASSEESGTDVRVEAKDASGVSEAGCISDQTCDDDNVCTDDTCKADGTCKHTPLAGLECSDGNVCTEGDKCSAEGVCVGDQNVDCDDDEPCTNDYCDEAAGCVNEPLQSDDQQPQDCDGSFCTLGDQCVEGECQAGDVKSCDDDNECTNNDCDSNSGSCLNSPLSDVACDDGNFCTDGDECVAGECVPGEMLECEDNNPCTTDSCNPKSGCMFAPVTEPTPCDDTNACTKDDQCAGPKCQGTAKVCEDDNPCTDNQCSPEEGCYFSPASGEACDDGDACTKSDLCSEGECVSGAPLDCSDGVECTVDMCDAGECKNVANHSACDDGKFCNGEESCDLESGCVLGIAPTLDDGIVCTVDTCDEENDEPVHAVDHTFCDDNDVCTGEEACDPIQGCLAGEELVCADDIDCTEDSCDPLEGCKNVPTDGDCDDENACSLDICSPETGCENSPLAVLEGECCAEDDDCDDANICTDDTCGIDFHCAFSNKEDGALCTDGLTCTLDDACLGGQCTGAADDCDDGLDCTVDSCDGDAGCVNTADSDFCDDENVCTGTEECDPYSQVPGTGCKAIEPLECDDEVSCTFDACDAVDGCSSVPQDGTCDDNNPCTLDVCDDEQDCLHTFIDGSDEDTQCCEEEDAECSDGIPCTKDTCNLDTHQCEAAEMANGQACSPNDLCKLSGVCQNGTCEAGDKVCEDNVSCTTNGCEPDSGCQYAADDQFCDDSNECTSESCSVDDDCVYVELDGEDCDDGNASTVDDACVQDLCSGLPDPDADGVANEGYGDTCANGLAEACNDNCPEVPNGDQADEDGNGVGDVCDGESTILNLFEPCADISPAFMGGQCDIGGPAYDDHTSSWQRTDEPFELPLVNGIIDDSVVWYLPLDGTAHDSGFRHSDGAQEQTALAAGAFGVEDTALLFNGSDSRILLDNALAPVLTDFTISIWFSPSETKDAYLYNHALGYAVTPWLSSDGQIWLSVCLLGNASCGSHSLDCGEYVPGKWYHLAAVWNGSELSCSMNGSLRDSDKVDLSPVDSQPPKGVIGGNPNIDGNPGTYAFSGAMDEFLLFNRALSPYEIESYFKSHKPYGYSLVPGSQTDLDDIRVSEKPAGGPAVDVLHDVVGPRPHSDTPCPMNEDDGTWADRDDLCGVVAYWPLDGDVLDVAGEHDSVNHGAQASTGRFGDVSGALELLDGSYVDSGFTQAFAPTDSFTIELWAKVDKEKNVFAFGVENSPGQLTLRYSATDYQFVVFDGAKISVLAQPIGFADGTWHHLACVRDVAAQRLRLFVDGVQVGDVEDTTGTINDAGRPLFIGANNHKDHGAQLPLDGKLDEFIIHKVAKSPDYIYRRANPGLPSVRFLVSTEAQPNGQTYPYKTYALKWGDGEAKHVVPLVEDAANVNGGKPCVGLLSPCNGYAGWWRFNEGGGTVVIDTSTSRHHGKASPSIARIAGIEGLAVDFGDSESVVSLPGQAADGLSNFTFETASYAESADWKVILWSIYNETFSDEFQALFDLPGDEFRVRNRSIDLNTALSALRVQWTHWVVSKQSSGLAIGTRNYVDEDDFTLSENQLIVPDNGFILGADQDCVGGCFSNDYSDGALDSFRIMNRVLTPDELLHHPMTRAWGLPYQCLPNCGGNECGDDGCGGSCGECEDELVCFLGQCADEGFAHIKAGTFWMGSPEGCPGPAGYNGDCASEPGREPWDSGNEELHDVNLTVAFQLQVHEVTQGEWKAAFGGWNPAGSTNGDSYPIENVSWFDGCAYANYRSSQAALTPCYVFTGVECAQGGNPADETDYAFCLDAAHGGIGGGTVTLTEGASKPYACQGFRLPTDAEWEYAARAGSNTAFYPSAGNDGSITEIGCELDANLDIIGWYCGNNTPSGTKPVGERASNVWGLKDMSGNVWEWTWDNYCTDNTGYGDDPVAGDCGGTERGKRGGSWDVNAKYCRSALRDNSAPGAHSNAQGFRLARSLE
jgi:formylglycine-generating enzyme required for sulfatase activity